MSTWIDNEKESENEQGPEETTLTTHNHQKNTTTKNLAGLLVRDDSITMNRSSNLSSSSITEVSSLMPSTSVHFQIPSASNRKSTILDVSQYIASEEEFKRLKTIRNSARAYTDDIDYKYLFNHNHVANSQEVKREDHSMQINQCRRSLRPTTSSSSSTSIHTSMMRPFANSTIGEIMERRSVLASFSGTNNHKSTVSNNMNPNELVMTTSDSGRDSLDSPNDCNAPVASVNSMVHGASLSNSKSLLSAKPYLIESNTSSIGSVSATSISNSNVKITANSSHLLDTHC